MIQIVREVSADVVKRGSTRSVYAKQYDLNSRFMNVRIQEDGKDIKVDSTVTVILNVERPDKMENMFYGTVNEDGTVKIPLTAWMLELEGTLLCDISLVAEDETVAKLTTMQFNIYVEAAVRTDESIIETEDYSVIVDLLKRTTDAEQLASTSAERAAEAAANAEELKAQCEDATLKANEAADNANAVRENVEAGGYIESVKELNKGAKFSWWLGTLAEYQALDLNNELRDNCFYILTDDSFARTTEEDLDNLFIELETLKASYASHTEDTGWLPLIDVQNGGASMGTYRLKSGIAYFNFQGSNWTGSSGKTLPVYLDTDASHHEAYFSLIEFNGSSYQSMYVSYVKNGGMLVRNGIQGDPYTAFYGVVAFPYNVINPNYALG